jgi:deoxyribodipyrimidine photo-lyase
VFNPVTQGQKFDPIGSYVRTYIPEISSLPDKYLFNPWDAPEHILKEADIELGTTYPKPIVDLKISRTKALEAFQSL